MAKGEDAPSHDGRVEGAAREPFRDVVLVLVRLVDDLLGNDFFDNIFERYDADGSAFSTGCAAQEEKVSATSLTRRKKQVSRMGDRKFSGRTSSRELGNN